MSLTMLWDAMKNSSLEKKQENVNHNQEKNGQQKQIHL